MLFHNFVQVKPKLLSNLSRKSQNFCDFFSQMSFWMQNSWRHCQSTENAKNQIWSYERNVSTWETWIIDRISALVQKYKKGENLHLNVNEWKRKKSLYIVIVIFLESSYLTFWVDHEACAHADWKFSTLFYQFSSLF